MYIKVTGFITYYKIILDLYWPLIIR